MPVSCPWSYMVLLPVTHAHIKVKIKKWKAKSGNHFTNMKTSPIVAIHHNPTNNQVCQCRQVRDKLYIITSRIIILRNDSRERHVPRIARPTALSKSMTSHIADGYVQKNKK